VEVDTLLRALRITREQLDEVVETNNKRRFAFDETGTRIRASQGHSVPVDLALPDTTPPNVLYHGTVAKFLDAIQREGLRPMKRHAVHPPKHGRYPADHASSALSGASSGLNHASPASKRESSGLAHRVVHPGARVVRLGTRVVRSGA
jgi:hypothetical protein